MSRRGHGTVPSGLRLTIVYMGLVPFDWDENNLRSVVCGSGNIVDVRLGFDYSGKNKGFCFIEYQTPQDAQRGLGLLGQIIIHTGPNKWKKLRVELSKEALRQASDTRQVLQLDRNYLPSNVELPPEMLRNGPPVNQQAGQGSFGGPQGVPPVNQPLIPNKPQLNQPPMNQVNQQIPPIQTTRNLPQPPVLPFTAPDKISMTLAAIPPAQLIELITNLKAVLSSSDAYRAAEVFNLSDSLASSASQALLLMGFIDGDVINDSINQPTPPPPHQAPQVPQGLPPPPPPQQSKWPFLPIATQQRLAAMAPEQADLIAQVLTIPVEQIPSLDPDKQAMIANLRAQYL